MPNTKNGWVDSEILRPGNNSFTSILGERYNREGGITYRNPPTGPVSTRDVYQSEYGNSRSGSFKSSSPTAHK